MRFLAAAHFLDAYVISTKISLDDSVGKSSRHVFNSQQEAWSAAHSKHYSSRKSLQEGLRLVLLTSY